MPRVMKTARSRTVREPGLRHRNGVGRASGTPDPINNVAGCFPSTTVYSDCGGLRAYGPPHPPTTLTSSRRVRLHHRAHVVERTESREVHLLAELPVEALEQGLALAVGDAVIDDEAVGVLDLVGLEPDDFRDHRAHPLGLFIVRFHESLPIQGLQGLRS